MIARFAAGLAVAGLLALTGPGALAATAPAPTPTGGSGTGGTTSNGTTTGTTTSGTAGTTGSPGTATPSSVVLKLTSISPGTLDATTPLVVSGTARNATGKPISSLEVVLRLRSAVLTDRAAIDTWLSTGTPTVYDRTLPGTVQLKTLAPKASKRFTITVPPGLTGLSAIAGSFGPRAIAVEARTATGTVAGTEEGELRSTVVWAPTSFVPRTRLSLLVPLTSTTASSQAGAPSSAVAQSLLPDGRLGRVLAATKDQSIGWAVDPALLTAAQALSSTGVVTPTGNTGSGDPAATPTPAATPSGAAAGTTDARTTARGWLSTFQTDRTKREVFGLPYADPDIGSVLNTKDTLSLLRHSDALGRQQTQKVIGGSLDTSLAWPGDGKVSTRAVSALGRTGRTAVVIGSADQPPAPAVSYTPSGRSTLTAGGKTLTGLLYDEQLSDLFTGSGSTGSTVQDTQTMLAELAAISRETPDTRQVLAVAPRTWNPNPAGVQALLSALHAAAWVSLRDVSLLRKAAVVPRANPAYHRSAVNAQLPFGQITAALVLSRSLDNFGPALSDAEPVIDPLRQEVASLLSVAWRSDRPTLNAARTQVASNVNGLVNGVRLEVGSSKPLIPTHSTSFPVTIVNRTRYAVNVRVQLRPQSGQLRFDEQKVTKAPAHSQTLILIKTKAIAGGNVVVESRLMTPTGQQLGPTRDFTVRVRPNWENRGMIGTGSVFGLLFLIGLLRSIRRRRPRVPPEAVPDVDDLATSRAVEAGLGTGAIPLPISIPGVGSGGSGRGGSAGSSPSRPDAGADDPTRRAAGSSSANAAASSVTPAP